jgi:hypothetical protein
MDLNNIVLGALNLLMLAFGVVIWASFKETKQMAKEAQDKLAEYKIHCAEKFITSDELSRVVYEINASLEKYATRSEAAIDKILAKLDSKQDK